MADIAQKHYLKFLVGTDGKVDMETARVLIKQVEKLIEVKEELAEAVGQIEALTNIQLSNANDFEAQLIEITKNYSAEVNSKNEQIQNISACSQQFEKDNQKLAAQGKQKDITIADITVKLNQEIKKSYHASKDQGLQIKLMTEEIKSLKEKHAAQLEKKDRENKKLCEDLERSSAASGSLSARTKTLALDFLKSLQELGPPPAPPS